MSSEMIEKLCAEPVPVAQFRQHCRQYEQEHDDCLNAIALGLARRFLDGKVTFDVADEAMNRLFSIMVDLVAESGEESAFADPAYSIYLAFGDGEVSWPRGEDPVARYTRPKLIQILSAHPD